MDSLTQATLGAAVGVAVMGRRTAVWKSALWGAACGTLPDLDTLARHDDPVADMVLHRADSHALFWLTLAAPPIAWGVARLHGEQAQWRRWWLALWLVLVTHPLLDAMTIYGTQLLRPFSDHPFGVGSLFIIDPLYTLPLLAGVVFALARRDGRGLRWNLAGLAASTAYVGWSLIAQQHVQSIARASLDAQGIVAQRVLVTPSPFNTVMWRVVAVTPDAYHEGFYSLLDAERTVRFDRFDRGAALRGALAGHPPVEQLARFTHGFYALAQHGPEVRIADLRMGQNPAFAFEFAVARLEGSRLVVKEPSRATGGRMGLRRGLPWLGLRILGHPLAPPR